MGNRILWVTSGVVVFLEACGAPATALRPSHPFDQVDSTNDGFSANVYKNIVRARVIESFERLGGGDASKALALMADDVHYRFEGNHALGGERVSKQGVEKWFGRLLRLFRSHFVMRSVEVKGGPWRSTVYAVFDDHVSPVKGTPYVNHCVQIIELRWGKAIRVRTYLDTARIEAALQEMARAGIGEAAAAPIVE